MAEIATAVNEKKLRQTFEFAPSAKLTGDVALNGVAGFLSVRGKRRLKPLELARVFSEEFLPQELQWADQEKFDMGGWSPRETCTNNRSRSRRAQAPW